MLFVGERRRSKWRPGAIRARDVRAADLQEKPTKRVKNKAGLPRQSFRWIRRRRRLPSETSQRAERAIKHSEHSERSNQIVQLWIAL
jgi:hypothetical protein